MISYRQHTKRGKIFCETEAEEVTQETFYQALKSMSSFRGDCKLIVWLCQIAKHIYFNWLKKGKRMTAHPPEVLFSAIPDNRLDSSPEWRMLQEFGHHDHPSTSA